MILYPNAKINLGLNVVERRIDGYHNIETVIYPIGLTDILNLQISDTCDEYSFTSSGIHIDGDTDQNLIIKAYKLLQLDYQIPPLDISLCKQIPCGAGLGGGSSDAAFMLKGINELFQLNISVSKLESYASKLGADCPFFIENEPVYATGIGTHFEKFKPLLKGYYLLLVKPDVHVSTAAAYSKVIPKTSGVSLIESLELPISEWKYHVKNDFELSVFSQHPMVGSIKEQLYSMGALYASMSGSGSSVYGIFQDSIAAHQEFDSCFVVGGVLD
jgi:4-diphosphocytidyl-2-C-methyl-D-erythritol kinase